MSIRTVCYTAFVQSHRVSFSRIMPIPHASILKVMKSTLSYKEAERIFEINKFISELPIGWKERFIVISNEKKLQSGKKQQKMTQSQSNNVPLSFEEFKKQQLITFEQYTELHRDYYDIETIRKGYDCYCKARYQSYLIEKEQVNPGIIL